MRLTDAGKLECNLVEFRGSHVFCELKVYLKFKNPIYFNSTPPLTNRSLESAMNKETIKGNIEKKSIMRTEGKINTNGACLSKRSSNVVFIVIR